MSAVFVAGLIAGAAGCGSEAGGEPDGSVGRVCWRDPVAVAGSCDLGIGIEFQPVASNDEVWIERGPQGGHHIIVNARMTGLDPGTDAPINERPLTRFSLTNEQGERIDFGGCAFRAPYAPLDEADPSLMYMDYGRLMVLETAVDKVAELDGTRATIGLEIVDLQGLYASDELSVVLRYEEPSTITSGLNSAGSLADTPADSSSLY